MIDTLTVQRGYEAYDTTFTAMRAFTDARSAATANQLWMVEHPPVFTLGLGADPAHIIHAHDIPIVQTDRGGEVTYHGPGQAVVYTLVDLARRGIKVREFVALLEGAVISLLGAHEVAAARRAGAPGVYVGEAKVAALGIRVTRGRAFHGVALNVDLDLAPFESIDPCGYPGLRVTRTRDLGIAEGCEAMGARLAARLVEALDHA